MRWIKQRGDDFIAGGFVMLLILVVVGATIWGPALRRWALGAASAAEQQQLEERVEALEQAVMGIKEQLRTKPAPVGSLDLPADWTPEQKRSWRDWHTKKFGHLTEARRKHLAEVYQKMQDRGDNPLHNFTSDELEAMEYFGGPFGEETDPQDEPESPYSGDDWGDYAPA